MKLYGYKKCSTCQKAQKFLESNNINYVAFDITQTPPTKTELRQMLKIYNGDLKKLFNTSGVVYREMKLSKKLNEMTSKQAIELLSQNGKLVKRPFLLKDDQGVVGFSEDEWKDILK